MSENNIALIENIYTAFARREYEKVLSYFADDFQWIAADNSPLADQSPYLGVESVRKGVFDRIAAGFEKLDVIPNEIFSAEGGRVVILGYYHGIFRGRTDEFRTQVAHIWTIKNGKAAKFQQYVDTKKLADDAGYPA